MYQTLLFFHSGFRWLALASLLYAIFRAYCGLRSRLPFTKIDNAVRHWTATIAHIQLLIGMTLYSQSPIVKFFLASANKISGSTDTLFFGLIHIVFMITSIVLITIGSAMAKRRQTDQEKFKTMLSWFSLAFVLIFIAIPWPFSPLANRPYLRAF